MRIVVLNGSPHTDGTVAKLLRQIVATAGKQDQVTWFDVCDLAVRHCQGCQRCRQDGECVLPEDDGHRIGRAIDQADGLVVGTPAYWSNMSGGLKMVFDRNVGTFFHETDKLLPTPQQKGKLAVIVTAYTCPRIFEVFFPVRRRVFESLTVILKDGGFRILGGVAQAGVKHSGDVSERARARADRLGRKLLSHRRKS